MATSSRSSVPTWNLKDLYSGPNDKRLGLDQASSVTKAKRFERNYRGKLQASPLKSSLVSLALKRYEAILQQAVKPVMYASLLHSTDGQNAAYGSLYAKTQQDYAALNKHLLFVELELSAQSIETLNGLIADPLLKPYRHFLERLLAAQPHRLSEAEEKILQDKALTGRQALTRLFEEEFAAKRFQLALPGQATKHLTEAQILECLNHPERAKRKAGADGLSLGLQQETRRLTFIYNHLIQDKAIDDGYRRFASPETARHLENDATADMVETLAQTVSRAYPLVQDYYRFKAKRLKLRQLFDYDRYAPIGDSRGHIPFSKAKDIILQAFGRFSPMFAKHAQTFFDHGWIDAAPKPGKRGGAYCSYITPDLHPYVFVNYQGRIKDVMTLAHELGHAIHATLAGQRHGYLTFDAPLTLAETASIFGEMLVFDHLKSNLNDPQDRLSLIAGKIEEIFASVFRQIAMYRFEQDAHALVRRQGQQSAQAFHALWRRRQQEIYGGSVQLSRGYDAWWSYIHHFFELPFYVYAYAFGELLTLSLYANYQKQGRSVADGFIALLSAGGSAAPQTLLADFDINLDEAKFWRQGIHILKDMIAEAKSLAA